MWIKKFTDVNMMKKDIEIRTMKIEDYTEVMALWKSIKGFRIRAVDDDFEHIKRFLDRNVGLSVVAVKNIAGKMVKEAIERVNAEGISKITLIAFKQNLAGNIFWKSQNWKQNKDINSYELVLNEENISSIVA